MPSAGYKSKLYASGSSTAFLAEPTTQIGATKSYQINTAIKRILDPDTAIVVKDGGVDHTADVLSIDPYFGIVTFKPTYAVGGAVTVGGSYLPLILVANIRSFAASVMAAVLDTSVNGTDHKLKAFGQHDAKGDFQGLDPLVTVINGAGALGDQSFWDWFSNDKPKLLEIDPFGTGTLVLRVWVVFQSLPVESTVETIVTRKIMWEGVVRELAGTPNVKTVPAYMSAA